MKKLPFLAFLLGLASLVPFFVLASAILFFGTLGPVPRLALALLSYGAVALAFSGAVHWGMALETPGLVPAAGIAAWDRPRLFLGVLAALWAWGALFCGLAWRVPGGIGLLILGFIVVLLCERRAWRAGAIPQGYMLVRLIVTIGAVLCLATGLGAGEVPLSV
ncbi:DUF3429 domain-containing protein [Acidomonas methanolica]|uniref:DUF3429 domain-containing protein n=1 Tax=Acidomonas methanolica TaxID=437 RepID=UPI00211A8E96|nr:DUF3429 domain-containing protein [Acidomonas methanolica]